MATQKTALDDKLHWYKDAIIYELHIKAFRDSNGDGIGDFQGLLEKLDYLQDLGVTAIWVLPFYPSPLRDDGYDIADYYSINPSYGNIEQFQQFLQEAHNRNLKVITELVINHTSDQHPWFQRARKAPKGSPEREYYVWTDDPTQYKDVRIIFQDFEASNWTWDPVAQQYYWHRFFHHQPDLNYDNPLVQEEVMKILDYWCAMGVDGFRLDAVPYLYEREGTNGENLPETHAFLKQLRKHMDENFPGTVFLAEANMWPEDSASYFGDGDECHMNYHFPVMPRMFMAVQMEDRYPITDIFDQTPEIPETCQWAIFLRNHDELTLEMVTDDERDYMYKMYAKNPKARINLGIRHRLAPLMDNDRRKIELLNSLLFSLAGTPVLYYGDEIGMGDNVYLGDRDGVRTPMQWTPDRNAGFSVTNPQKLYLPVILDPAYHYEAVNVETQWQNTSSLLWFTKRMINMRKRHKAFGRGDLKFLNVENPKVLAFTRTYEDETLLIVVNLSKHSQPAEIDLTDYKGYRPVEVFSKNRFPVIKDEQGYPFTLAPYDYQWFTLQKVHSETDPGNVPQLTLAKWDDLTQSRARAKLENEILPAYLEKAHWFIGKGRALEGVTIADQAVVGLADKKGTLLLIEVTYEQGLPELYQIPVTFVQGERASQITASSPQAVLAQLKLDGEEGLLCDALFTSRLHQLLFASLVTNQSIPAQKGKLVFSADGPLKAYDPKTDEPKSKVYTTDRDYTAISYDNRFFLKMYRKVDWNSNSDVEISRYLTEEAKFEYAPTFIGTIEWQSEKGTVALGMIEELIENHGDGHSFMLERIHNYIERILARNKETLSSICKQGSWTDPMSFEELSPGCRELLGGTASEQARLLGVRTGQLHLALANTTLKDFAPEAFSLHYQRSLFAGMQSLVRETYQVLDHTLNHLSPDLQQELAPILGKKQAVLTALKRVYAHKFDALKIRIHGNYHLAQVLLTGKDLAIQDFGGNPQQSVTTRRIKRSPLRDVAAMIRSFYYAAYEGFMATSQVPKEEVNNLLSFADLWAYQMSGIFLKSYLETVEGSAFFPKNNDDFQIMLETYLVERAISDLNDELKNRPEQALLPARILKSIID
ncbi:maltose alpha-D-glucosyltransferase/alpha-amylase [Larkinella arboricola]|uniref:Maltokinase n=1 Tax=Larkinella arboricola TaxID=643671 RepID=A0A327X9J5_LARAB|nr:maltose alpha-D-glucosyltransferase [Larkinella arboricola]RAK02764.1 maltose alpha-D-glucosyltransferase/alpha-amylase [Larkinella arboricola]